MTALLAEVGYYEPWWVQILKALLIFAVLFQLVPIAPSDRDAAVDAEQAVATATARRDAAALKTQRAERLFKDGSGSRRALEEAQAELAVAEADLTAARGRVALASRSRSSAGGIVIE